MPPYPVFPAAIHVQVLLVQYAGAILFLAKDITFPPLPSPSNSPTFAPSPSSFHNSSSHLYGNDQGSTTIHSCFHPSSSAATSTTPSSSTMELFTLMSDFQRGLLVSCILLSALVGALCASSVADTIGRRPTQIFTNLFFIIGCAGMYFAPNNISSDDDHGYWILVGSRSITGLGVGVSSVLVNLYITEISPAKSRGELGSWAPFAVTAGILASYVLSGVLLFSPADSHKIAPSSGPLMPLIPPAKNKEIQM